MRAKPKQVNEEKTNLHPRNAHRDRYDFPALIKSSPGLSEFVSLNNFNDLSVDFKNPQAVKALNKALLKHFYHIDHWDIPNGYLCPPIPGRADHLHYLADLLAACNSDIIPYGKQVNVLDIGTGANCIYPLIGHKVYGWNFAGSDIDGAAIRSAQKIIDANKLTGAIELRKQPNPAHIFNGVIQPGELFDLTVCNPPFHSSLKEATAGTQRKWANLGHEDQKKAMLNFGGQNAELWCAGGEKAFLSEMVRESTAFAQSCLWFSSLVSKQTTLPGVYHALKTAGASEVETISMSQGQKSSRIVAWTFMERLARETWCLSRWR